LKFEAEILLVDGELFEFFLKVVVADGAFDEFFGEVGEVVVFFEVLVD
jgi:hypothetical protein